MYEKLNNDNNGELLMLTRDVHLNCLEDRVVF